MTESLDFQLGLEDLLADLRFARKQDELGRLALLAYCDVKGWARRAGEAEVADKALRMFSEHPCLSKMDFLESIDALIATLEQLDHEYQKTNVLPALAASTNLSISIRHEPMESQTSHSSTSIA